MDWRHVDPQLGARAHHVEGLTREANEHRLVRGVLAERRLRHRVAFRAWLVRTLARVVPRRRRVLSAELSPMAADERAG